MRASRLLTILMLLQTRGRLSAETLAAELEVSVRTVYRDVDELSASGVPIYAETGRNGGFALLDGWRTRLTGLTAAEAKALFLAGLPGPAAELGLGEAVNSAELKLLAALPNDWQREATRIAARFHLDPRGWSQAPDRSEHLRTVAEAVWTERRIKVRYESWTKTADRVLEPLGLVLKAGAWYMAARRNGDVRTYRLAAVRSLALTDERFERPKDFDLPAYWAESMSRFERDVYTGTAEVRATELGIDRLKEMGPVMKAAVEAAASTGDEGGWRRLTIPVEETPYGIRQLGRIGPEIEILSPPHVRAGVAEIARRMARLYAADGQ